MQVTEGRCLKCRTPVEGDDAWYCSEECYDKALADYIPDKFKRGIDADTRYKWLLAHATVQELSAYADQWEAELASLVIEARVRLHERIETEVKYAKEHERRRAEEILYKERVRQLERLQIEKERQQREQAKQEAKQREADDETRLAEEAERALHKDFADLPIPAEQRFSGHWIIAPPGRGKTNLLHAMFCDDLKRNASIVVLDSKGDLIEPVKKLAALKDRVVLIEPDPDFPLALNPLDIPRTNVAHTISLLEYIFSALLEAKMTALQQTLFRSVLPALVEVIPNPTLETFRDIITNGVDGYEQYIRKLPRSQQEFFFDKQTGFLSKTYTDTRNQLIWRLQFLMTNPIIRQMFGAMKTKFDIGKEMDAGKTILINNSKAVLGDEGAEFFGRFFIALILAAAQQRAGRRNDQKLPCFVYIDECHNVIRRDEKIPTILDECRSQKIGLILAHQRTAQLDPKVLDAVANCAIRFANSDDEAKFLADKLRTSPEFLRSLPRGTFAAFVRDLTPQALALKIPYVDMDALPKMSAQEQQAIRRKMREQFSFTPQTHDPAEAASRDRERQPAEANTPIVRPPQIDKPAIGTHTETGEDW